MTNSIEDSVFLIKEMTLEFHDVRFFYAFDTTYEIWIAEHSLKGQLLDMRNCHLIHMT